MKTEGFCGITCGGKMAKKKMSIDKFSKHNKNLWFLCATKIYNFCMEELMEMPMSSIENMENEVYTYWQLLRKVKEFREIE